MRTNTLFMILTLGTWCKCGDMIIMHNQKSPSFKNGYEENLTWCFLFLKIKCKMCRKVGVFLCFLYKCKMCGKVEGKENLN
jgi:predicted RNA-binding Zn-ribbon protein involved in translation (DUF1610 family)